MAPFKVGPDFIDPGHHTKICGKTSFNLDSWMLSKRYNQQTFMRESGDADVAVVEGVMGLFDGYDGLSEAGSTAQMAKWLNLPVVLIVSAKGKARSAAAIVKGFETFDRDLNLAGVIFTKTGSQRHYEYLKAAVEQSCRTKCLGHLPKNEGISMPERHLGLVTADEMSVSPEVLDTLSAMVEEHIDTDALMGSLTPVVFEDGQPVTPSSLPAEDIPTIAVARDEAFCFYYPDNIDLLRQAGARIVEFSPLRDESLPENIDGIYLGGGYPEVHAARLASKQHLLGQIKSFSDQGMPIYGECGGFMVLCSALTGMDDAKSYSMTGCFGFTVTMSKRLRSLGYREITLTGDTVIGKKGDVLRGHEFHYSSLENPDILKDPDQDISQVYDVTSRAGQSVSLKGYQHKNTLGSYFHVHFGSHPGSAGQFVSCCRQFKLVRQQV